MNSKSNRHPKDSKGQSISTFVRCRPMNDAELSQKCVSVVDVKESKEIYVHDRHNPNVKKTFSFDKVFDPSTRQVDIYRAVVEPIIPDILSGYNCTVFAYGPTGTGKTHTMEGPLFKDSMKLSDHDSMAGIIPRVVCALMDELRVLQSEFTLQISFLQLYNEEIYDLLSPDPVPSKLRMFDDSTKKGSVIVQGLQEVMVHTRSQVFDKLRKASAKKHVAVTLLNAQSSRSHTVFCVTIHMKENSMRGEELLKTGKLILVDLAGSENTVRSGLNDKRTREAGSINQSLLTLGRVISGIVERWPHVPFRESKLTRLLQDSLGGKTKTYFIATISPANSCLEETVNALELVQRAKHIINRPEANQKVSKTVIMKEYMDIIKDLKQKLDLHRKGSGIYIADENYQEMEKDWADRNKELTEVVAEMRGISQKMEATEETCQHLSSTVLDKSKTVQEKDSMLKEMRKDLEEAEQYLQTVVGECEEAGELVKKVAEQEERYRRTAASLLAVTEEYDQLCDLAHKRFQMTKASIQANQDLVSEIRQMVVKYSNNILEQYKPLVHQASSILQYFQCCEGEAFQFDNLINSFKKCLSDILNLYARHVKQFREIWMDKDEKRKNLFKKSLSDLKLWHDSSVEEIKNLTSAFNLAMALLHKIAPDLIDHITSVISCVSNKRSKFEEVLDQESSALSLCLENIDSVLISKRKDIEEVVHSLHTKKQQDICEQINQSEQAMQSILDVKETVSRLASLNSKLTSDEAKSYESSDKQMTTLDEAVVKYNTTLEDQLREVVNVSKNTRANIHAAGTSLVNDISENIDSIYPFVEKVSHCVGDLPEKLDAFKTDQEIHIKDLASNADTFVAQKKELHCTHPMEQEILKELNATPKSIQNLHSLKIRATAVATSPASHCHLLDSFSTMAETVCSDFKDFNAHQKLLLTNVMEPKIAKDVSTGLTPARKTHPTLPVDTSLPSPIEKKVKSRVHNALEKLKTLRQTPKIRVSCLEEEEMASDSEVTFQNHLPSRTLLSKSSSLSDLQEKVKFSQPRVPLNKKLRYSKKKPEKI